MSESQYAVPQGLIELVERRYDVKVIASHYILVDAKFERYNIMYDMVMPEMLEQAFHMVYGDKESALHVKWEKRPETKSIRFFAEKGHNILLLLDRAVSFQQKEYNE